MDAYFMETNPLAARPADPSRFPSDADLRGYDRAQSFAKRVAATIAAQVEVGMSERDATAVAKRVFNEYAIRHHWHTPLIGVGEGSAKFTSAGRFLGSFFGAGKRTVREGDLLFIDIAPFFEGYPSDFTLTKLYGENPRLQDMIGSALTLTRSISSRLREGMRADEAWKWMKSEVESQCPYELLQFPINPMAHRFSKVPENWPLFKEVGMVHLLSMGAPLLLRGSKTSMRGLWVIEPFLVDRELNRAAKTEEVVFVTESTTVIFGEKAFE